MCFIRGRLATRNGPVRLTKASTQGAWTLEIAEFEMPTSASKP
jgi:hypothetical protein